MTQLRNPDRKSGDLKLQLKKGGDTLEIISLHFLDVRMEVPPPSQLSVEKILSSI